jgi:methyl coenzyme M reductase subunit D
MSMEADLKSRINLQKDRIVSLNLEIGKIKIQLDKDKKKLEEICDHKFVNECEPNSCTMKVCKKCDKIG